MLRNDSCSEITAWTQDVELELRRLYRKRMAVNQLIRACEEYALVVGEGPVTGTVQSLMEALPIPLERKPTLSAIHALGRKRALA